MKKKMQEKRILFLNCDYEKIQEANEAIIFNRLLNRVGIKDISVFNIYDNEFPKDDIISNFNGIIISGSNASVYENLPWIPKLAKLIHLINDRRIPTYGVCFGSQIIANSFGGTVKNSGSEEVGFVDIDLTEDGIKNPLFKGFKKKIIACSWHNDIITELPKGSVLLARNDFSIQSFRYNNFYCTQFHPEFSPKIAKIIASAENVSSAPFENVDEKKIIQEKIIYNFIDMI